MATLKGPSGAAQPVTAKPELGLVGAYPMVYVGTGRYIGVSDIADTSQQSIYAIKDKLDSTSFGSPRDNTTFVRQTMTATTCPAGSATTICTPGQSVRTSTDLEVNLGTKNGWYVDLLDSGERANNDPQLSFGTLVFTTNVPTASACTIGGYSYIYFFNYATGGPVSTSTTGVVGKSLGNAMSTRPVLVKLPNNKVISIVQKSDATVDSVNTPIGAQNLATRRVSWRELVAE